MTTIHAGDCSTDCPTCVANCACFKCRTFENWLVDNQINGDDGTGFNDYKEGGE